MQIYRNNMPRVDRHAKNCAIDGVDKEELSFTSSQTHMVFRYFFQQEGMKEVDLLNFSRIPIPFT